MEKWALKKLSEVPHTHMNVCMWKSIKIQLSTGKK